ncbi:MAG: substrate-binding periplasmic protein [Desulfovibrio sp.]
MILMESAGNGGTSQAGHTIRNHALRRAFVLAALAVLLLPPSAPLHAGAGDSPKLPPLKVYTEESAVTRLSNGTITGFFVDLMREMLRRARIPGEIAVVPWKRAYLEAQEEPNVLLFPTAYIPERAELFHWLDPIFRVRWVFYAKRPAQQLLTTLDNARKVGGIAVYREDVRHQYLRWLGFKNLEVVDSTAQGWRMLLQHRVDLLAASNASVTETDYAERLDRNTLESVLTLSESVLHPVFSLDTDPALVRACDKALKEMIADGAYGRIYRRWYAAREYATAPTDP